MCANHTTIGGIRTSICSFQGTHAEVKPLSAGHPGFVVFRAPGIMYLTRFVYRSDHHETEFFVQFDVVASGPKLWRIAESNR